MRTEAPRVEMGPAPLERLEAEITELAGNLAAAECRWLGLIAEYDRRAGFESWGCRSCAHWLSWHCGLDLRAAYERVRVARALEQLPLTVAAFGAGRLSYSKVRALTRVATPENEHGLLMIAEHATAVQVERTVRAYRGVLSTEEENEAANVRHAARYLRYEWNDDGSLQGHFRIPPEMAAIFLAAVKTAREQVPADSDQDTGENCPAEHKREFATTNCDALVMMAESFLANGPAARSGSDRYQIVVNADASLLAGIGDGADVERRARTGVCELDDGPALASETLRRLACDASIVTITTDTDGRVIGISSKAPAIPASTRRAVRRRDRGCRWPGCGGRIFVNVHHIRHRAHHGDNSLGNLVELCWHHHRLVHEGGWNVRLEPDGVIVAIRPDGSVLASPPQAPPPQPNAIETENRTHGIAIDATTCIPRWRGEHLDLDHIVTGLLCLDRPGYATN
jgi:5-methylcytosine-specific restriction endonuclease McrA